MKATNILENKNRGIFKLSIAGRLFSILKKKNPFTLLASFIREWFSLIACLGLFFYFSYNLPSMILWQKTVVGGSYNFKNIEKNFGKVNVHHINEIPKSKVHEILSESLPVRLRKYSQKYLEVTLSLAEYYQVDPLWVLAVMWTESSFNPKATSVVSAKGLMQIMPQTKKYLKTRIKNPLSPDEYASIPKEIKSNIEMGIFYLNKMLHTFKDNYTLATVAYNMGPSWVKKRIRRRRPVGTRNDYLDKIRHRYQILAEPFSEEIMPRPTPYLSNYVIKTQSLYHLKLLIASIY